MTGHAALIVTEPRSERPVLREMLRVALGDAERWSSLRGEHELHELRDSGPRATQLLPAIAHVLQQADVDHPDREAFGKATASVGFRNDLLAHHATQVVDAFAEANVDAQVLKGLAIGSMAYPDLGCRPMADVDILVAPDDLDRALGILTDGGVHTPLRPLNSFMRRTRHSLGTFGPAKIGIDVHWAIHRSLEPSGVSYPPLPTTAVPIRGRPTPTPTPTVHLLHAAIRGPWEADVRWALDAALLIERCPIDWDALCTIAADRQVNPLVHDGLRILHDLTGVGAPPAPLAELRNRPVPNDRLRRLRRVARIGPLPDTDVPAVEKLRDRWVKAVVSEPPIARIGLLPRFALDECVAQWSWRRRQLDGGSLDGQR